MKKTSAGILMFRRPVEGAVEVLLVHPGGPFWAKKDVGAWSIPKGEFDECEDAEAAARREFREEMGCDVDGALIPLGSIRQKNGKEVVAWAVEGDFDCATLVSNMVSIQWPPKSGRRMEVPEVDRAQWFPPDEARVKMHAGQPELVDRLLRVLEPPR
jgi:predicted NUDIX family NTP pyrophosphohydrolase